MNQSSETRLSKEPDYRIVSGVTIYELERAVKNYMPLGWRPMGGIEIGKDRLMQVMVKNV